MAERYIAYEITSHAAIIIVDEHALNDKNIFRFNVTDGHSYETQKERAIEYASFLNKQEAAMQRAAKNVTIVSAVAQRLLGTQDENEKPKDDTP